MSWITTTDTNKGSRAETEERLALLRYLKERHPTFAPLEIADIWYRYHRRWRTYKLPLNSEKMNKAKTRSITGIEERRKQLGISITLLAEKCGRSDAWYHSWRKRGEVPVKEADKMKRFLDLSQAMNQADLEDELAKEMVNRAKSYESNESNKPTIAEIARINSKKLEEEEEKSGKPIIEDPSLADLKGLSLVRVTEVEPIRRGLQIPMSFMSRAMGWKPWTWSTLVDKDATLNTEERDKLRDILTSLIYLRHGVPSDPRLTKQNEEIREDIISSLTMLGGSIMDRIPNQVDRHVAKVYVNSVIELVKEI